MLGLTKEDQGLGIALVAAQKAQIPVIIIDNSQASIDKGLKFAGQSYAWSLYYQEILILC